jgi:hypothetical protein
MNQLEPSWAKGYPGGPRWRRVAATRDLPTIAFFRAGVLLRRSVPVPGILATTGPGRLWISLSANSLSDTVRR